jgi:hypothetical protein
VIQQGERNVNAERQNATRKGPCTRTPYDRGR